ncbi:dephospho-CoA kinase [Blattabacterium cuenoti]|uniref:dephospho-CoA kinase n=1 Tax=Blattabacterium cuenoti TaxID=1653831 RepID=UPI001EEC4390|nr:dephospho-CoA kinase [Blattabacterium cuenoti]
MLIGITGKIGSGKSLFSSFFKKKGIPIYYSDKRGKILMNEIDYIKKNIIKYFGINSYKKGKINRNYLSKIVFNDSIALKLLCTIVHPWISIDFKNWMFSMQKNALYVIKESAILFESGNYKECDLIITIKSTMEKILDRIKKRDNLNENQIINRIKNQISNKKREKKSNIIVNNCSSITFLLKKADIIHNKIIKIKYGKRR